MSNFPAPPVSWSDVARVCRRVCLLRERGQNEEAEHVRSTMLAELLIAVRSETDTDASIAERLESIFAHEADRVANAAILAEMLAPLLSEKISSSAPAPSLPVPVVAAAPAPLAAAKPAAPRAGAGSIADFIDEMIAQEGPPARPGGAQRRAS